MKKKKNKICPGLLFLLSLPLLAYGFLRGKSIIKEEKDKFSGIDTNEQCKDSILINEDRNIPKNNQNADLFMSCGGFIE
jgi:hypothetical protein